MAAVRESREPQAVSETARGPDEPPPIATWPALYALVIGALVVIILLLAWLTRALS